jgi:cytochrome c-type biogenesis protein CcmH/NrfF
MRRLAWVAVAVVSVVALSVAAFGDPGPRTAEERVRDIAETIRCPQCAGQSVADSETSVSRSIRSDIARRVSAGEDDDQIRSAIAGRYTDAVLLEPGRSGLAAAVWAIPVLVLVIALAALAAVFARWRSTSVVGASEEDRALVERARADLDV